MEEAIPSPTLPIPSLARVTSLRIPSELPSNHDFHLGDEYAAGFIAASHKDGPFHATLGDGIDVGMGSILGRQRSVFTYEQHPAIDNRVGVTGRLEKSIKSNT